jgi:hypothetical protein
MHGHEVLPVNHPRPLRALVAALAGIAAVGACGGTGQSGGAPASPAPATIELGSRPVLSKTDLAGLAAAFPDAPFDGGQTAPLFARMVTDRTFVFVQLDRPKMSEATGVAYLGVGVRGAFCAQTQPDRTGGSFPVFQQASAPSWAAGLGGKAGAAGYWLNYVAVDRLSVGKRAVPVGIDYAMPGRAAPSCASPPATTGASTPSLTPDAISALFAVFPENPLQGGQVPPRTYRALNDRVLGFLQFDHNAASQAKELRYLGIAERSTFCKSTQPSPDFTHFHDLVAPAYAQGHGGAPNTAGFWGTWIAAESFESQGRSIAPGVDREFSPTPPPNAC